MITCKACRGDGVGCEHCQGSGFEPDEVLPSVGIETVKANVEKLFTDFLRSLRGQWDQAKSESNPDYTNELFHAIVVVQTAKEKLK